MEVLLLILLLFLGVFAAANVGYALIMLAVLLVRVVMTALVIPVVTLLARIVALPFQVIGWLLAPSPVAAGSGGVILGSMCDTRGCGCDNPAGAKFCRRCGRRLEA